MPGPAGNCLTFSAGGTASAGVDVSDMKPPRLLGHPFMIAGAPRRRRLQWRGRTRQAAGRGPMSTTVPCPHCSRKLLLRPEYVGRSLRCPACSQTFIVPDASAPPEAAPWPPEPMMVEPIAPEDLEAITSRPEPRPASGFARPALRSRPYDDEEDEDGRPLRK